MNLQPYDSQCSKSELELFPTPPVNLSMEKGDYVHYKPVSTLNNASPLEFHVPASSEEYVDLGRTSLYLKLKITNAAGTVLGAAAQAAFVNLPLYSIFSQVTLFYFFIFR